MSAWYATGHRSQRETIRENIRRSVPPSCGHYHLMPRSGKSVASTIQYACFPRLSPAIVVVAAACICLPGSEKKVLAAVDAAVDRSPVDLCLTADQRWIVTINQIANSVSLVRRADSKVVDEVACGQHPADIAITPAGQVLVTAS